MCSAEGGSREGRAAGSPKPFPRALLSTWKPRLGPNQGEAEEGALGGTGAGQGARSPSENEAHEMSRVAVKTGWRGGDEGPCRWTDGLAGRRGQRGGAEMGALGRAGGELGRDGARPAGVHSRLGQEAGRVVMETEHEGGECRRLINPGQKRHRHPKQNGRGRGGNQ